MLPAFTPLKKTPVVRTRSENVDKICKTLLGLMPAHAPDAPALQDLAQEYGANAACFEKEPSFCAARGFLGNVKLAACRPIGRICSDLGNYTTEEFC
jgi:hypothetical protein